MTNTPRDPKLDDAMNAGFVSGITELVRAVGGALLAFFAVLALVILTLAKLGDLAEASRGEAFVAVVGAISTIVGGYVGLKVGTAGKDAVEKKKEAAGSDVALLMGKLPPDVADEIKKELRSV
jgi:hypothetical protein